MPTSTARPSLLTVLPGSTAGRMSAPDTSEVKGSTAAPLTMGELLKACRDHDWPGDIGRFSYEKAIRLIKHMGEGVLVCDITPEYIDKLMLELRQEGLKNQRCQALCRPHSNATLNRHLSALRVMLLRAKRIGAIAEVPLFPERRTLRESEPRVFTPQREWVDDQVRHLDNLSPQSGNFIRFLADTGCRISEALAITWDQIDLSLRTATFTDTKGRTARTVRLNEDDYSNFAGLGCFSSLMWMQDKPTGKGDGPFSTLCGHQGTTRVKVFRRYFTQSKIAVCKARGLTSTTAKYWVPHTIRKARATDWLRRGVPFTDVMYRLGHKDFATTCSYYTDRGAFAPRRM